MICYRCGQEAQGSRKCPSCGADLVIFKKVKNISDAYYNQGLEQANVRNLSNAIVSLKNSLKFNKYNIDARNLLGLIYFETGEVVDALSEWVISKSYQSVDNLASHYLDEVQQNRGRLDSENQTIKKYNQALSYCRQDSRDLAIIQLKKVLSMNPRMVKAHQLLALLYLQEDKLELAKRSLRNAAKIDSGHNTTLRYMQEVNRKLKEREKGSSKKKQDDDLISYQSGNETIIMPKRFKESSVGTTIASIVIGLLIGTAVTSFLIVPTVKNRLKEETRQQMLEASDSISTKGQELKELEGQMDDLQQQLEKERENSVKVKDQTGAYDKLLSAYVAYVSEDFTTAGEALDKVEDKYLSKKAKGVYNELNGIVKEKYFAQLYNEGYSAYRRGRYADAIEKLKQITDEQEDYRDGYATYYLAQSYRRNNDLASAKPYYQYVIDNYPDTERSRTALNYVNAQE